MSSDVNSLYPSVAELIAGLPAGLDSYPECDSKMSIIRDRALRYRDRIELEALPSSVADLFRDPPPSTAWIPTVRWQCVSLAVRDEVFPGDAGLPDFLAMVGEDNARLFRSPLYRAILVLVSPGMLLRGGERRFHAFHRGVTLTVRRDASDDDAFVITLRHPPGLYHPTSIIGLANSFEAAALAAGGKDVTSEQLSKTSTGVVHRVRWR